MLDDHFTMEQRKICRGCLKEKTFSEFKTDNRISSGIAAQCKQCLNKKTMQWHAKNLKKCLENARNYKKKNKTKVNQHTKKYKKKNKVKIRALNAQRRAAKLKRTPKWLTKEDFAKIERIYKKAQDKTKLLGEKYHVDHIYPLQGKKVSGLHVPSNLQILTASENSKKNNRYSP